jgi:hypothetical protein
MRRLVVITLTLMLLFPLIWSVLTTPALTGKSVRIEFQWSKQSGFSHVRSVGGLAKVVDPPYDRYFTNPIVTAQSKRLILSQIKSAESARKRPFSSVQGRLGVVVCWFVYVRGLDASSETGHVEAQ